jgi:hypothetical protein
MFVCRGDAIARVTCCCPQSQHRPPAPLSAPTLSAACCCDISRLDVPAIPAEVDSAALALANHHHEVIGPAPGDASVSPPSSLDTWPAVLLAQPPPHAVPILLGKQSRLI